MSTWLLGELIPVKAGDKRPAQRFLREGGLSTARGALIRVNEHALCSAHHGNRRRFP